MVPRTVSVIVTGVDSRRHG